jgi:outer membrane protein assembly factor BamE (lipoprotein component of BamABCDE complex)
MRYFTWFVLVVVLLSSSCSSLEIARAEKRFQQVRIGMSKGEVERLLGPATAMLMSDSPETVLSWSATSDRPPIRWLNLYFNADGRVTRIEHMPATSK